MNPLHCAPPAQRHTTDPQSYRHARKHRATVGCDEPDVSLRRCWRRSMDVCPTFVWFPEISNLILMLLFVCSMFWKPTVCLLFCNIHLVIICRGWVHRLLPTSGHKSIKSGLSNVLHLSKLPTPTCQDPSCVLKYFWTIVHVVCSIEHITASYCPRRDNYETN